MLNRNVLVLIGSLGAVGLWGGCENGIDPQPTDEPQQEVAHETLTIIEADAFFYGEPDETEETFMVAPPIFSDSPATRVGVMGRLKTMGEFGDSGVDGLIEVRGQTGDGTWLGWRALETVFSEDTLFNAMTDFEEPVTLAELRLPADALGTVGALGWEVFSPGDESGEPEDIGDGVSLQGVAESEQGLRSELADMGIVTRAEWNAQSPRCTPWESNKWRMAIHHTASALATGLTNGKTYIKGTQNYHRNVRKWCDIAYHFAIAQDGTIFEGRDLALKGGHTSGYNNGVHNGTANIGIVFMGCFNNASGCNHATAPAMFEAAGRLTHRLADIYGIVRSSSTIKGHREHPGTVATSCPGNAVLANMDTIRTFEPTPDTTPPVLVGNIWRSSATVGGSLVVGFSTPVDDRGVTHIKVTAGNRTVTKAYTGTNSITVDGLLAYHSYNTTVWALDAAGNISSGISKTLDTGAFGDVGDTWYETAVAYIGGEAITVGCNPPANTLYCPLNDVTRAQMATFLSRALNLPPGPDAFVDDTGNTHEADINAIAAAGITAGCGPSAFCPDQPVTRGQMAAFLKRALDLPAGPDAFADDAGHTFEADINAIAAQGITSGCGGNNYCPDDNVTRAQMAVFLRNALE